MALPPLSATSRSGSPERSSTPPPGAPSIPRAGSMAGLAPLRGSITTDLPSPTALPASVVHRTTASGFNSPSLARSLAGGAGQGNVSQSSSQSSPVGRTVPVAARVNTGPRKLTQAQQADRLYGQLMEVLRTEWKSIRSSNLGVLSGTAVVEELLLRRIQTWAAELHCLAITHATAAQRLGALCRGMVAQELQQLLVMLDQTGHPELSDFVRLMVYNTGDPTAQTVVGDLRALRAANSVRKVRQGSSRRRPTATQLAPPRFIHLVPEDPSVLRFAARLPEGHRLVLGAQAAVERRRAEEEEQRRASEAREAKERAREDEEKGGAEGKEAAVAADAAAAGRRMSEASSRQAVLQGRAGPAELQPFFLADVEEQWRRTVATRLPADSVFDSCIMLTEPLPPYEAPPEVALMRLEAEEAAHSPPSRGGPLTRMNTMMSVAGGRAAPPTPGAPGAARTSIAGPWTGPGSMAGGYGRRPGAAGASVAAAGGGGGADGAGAGQGQGQGASRFGVARTGPRPVVVVPAPGAEAGTVVELGRVRRGPSGAVGQGNSRTVTPVPPTPS